MAFTKVTNAGIGSTNTVLLHNLNVVGTVTATDGIFSGIGSFGGNVTVGGVLTYEDVTNVDSVGLITARNGITVLGAGVTIAAGGLNVNAVFSTFGGNITVGSGITLSPDGDVYSVCVSTFKDIVYIADKILHDGDGNTAIRFPDADKVSVETGGTEALNVDSSQRVNIGGAAVSQTRTVNIGSNVEANLAIETHNDATSETANIRFYKSGNTGASPQVVETNDNIAQLIAYGHDGTDYANPAASIQMSVDGAPGSNDMPGKIIFSTNSGGTSATERLHITSAGKLGLGIATPDSLLHIHNGTAGSIAATSYANLTIESSDGTANTLQFLSPATAAQQIRFGDPADNGSGWIQYNHANNALSFGANGPERARIDSDGRFLISHSTSHGDMYSKLQVCDTSSSGSIDLARYTANAHPPYLNFFKSRDGTINGNTVVQDGDKLGYITFSGNDGSGFHEAASIYGVIDGTPGDNDMPGKLVFNTVPDGSTTSTERMTIDRNGKILLGTTRSQYTNDYYDDITINNSGGSAATGGAGITLISDSGSWGAIQFGDDDDDDRAYIKYSHAADEMSLSAAGADQVDIGGNVIDYFQHRTTQQIAGSQVAIGDGASKTFTITGLAYGWANVILGFYGEGHYCGVEISLGGLMAGGSTYYNSSIKMNVSSGDVTVSTAKNQTSYVITIANSVGNGGSIHGNSLFTGGGINTSHPAGAWS